MKNGTLSMGRTAGQLIDLFVGDEHIVIEISKVRGKRAQIRLTASERVRIVRREALDKQGDGNGESNAEVCGS